MVRPHLRRLLSLSALLALWLMALTISATLGPARAQETATSQAESTANGVHNLVPLPEARPAHIHAGTCNELGIVVYSLTGLSSYRAETGIEGAPRSAEMITGTADVELTELFNEPFAIHIHESIEKKQNYVACAEVGDRPAGRWQPEDGLALRLIEQNDSGYAGMASLRPGAGGGVTVTLFLAQLAGSEQQSAPQATPPPTTTYSSPTFGYTISYGPSWTVTENVSNDARDRFVLYNGVSYVTFTGATGYGGDTERCVEDFVAVLTADPNVSELRLKTGDNGEPLQGRTEATGAFAVYDHSYSFPDHSETLTLFVGCIPLVPGEAVIAVVQNVPAEDYDEQVEPRQALLRGLTLPQ